MIFLVDKYFMHPVKYDYLFASIIVAAFKKHVLYSYVHLPKEDIVLALSSEIVTILLTFAGFILTFLTILITFKLDAGKDPFKSEKDMSILEKFTQSGLYFQTTEVFKNSIKSVVFISVIIYSFRIIHSLTNLEGIYMATIFGIIILVSTLLRSLIVLDNILKLQIGGSNI